MYYALKQSLKFYDIIQKALGISQEHPVHLETWWRHLALGLIFFKEI